MIKISDKDWNRMYDLIADRKDGESVARSIRQKDKAIARFVAGLKLKGEEPDYDKDLERYYGHFSAFGNKALELGATVDEIKEVYDSVPAPESLIDQLSQTIDDTSYRVRIPDTFWKALRKANIPVKTAKNNRRAGPVATYWMEGNGRKWNIPLVITFYPDSPYECSVDLDVITDEGDGSNRYALYSEKNMKTDLPVYDHVGFEELKKKIFAALKDTPMGDELA